MGEAYDVVIVGGGNAAFGVTVPTRKAGLKVVMIEDRDLGGTCPNRGCTPKKVLVAAAHALHEIGASPCPLHKRRQAHARLGSADRPREGDDRGHPGLRSPRRSRNVASS